MEKLECKRYSLVYEYPSSDNMHIIDFKKDENNNYIWNTNIMVPKKNNIVKGKHTLAEIDMFTNSFNSFEHFNNLVLYNYFDENPNNTFILYKFDGYNSLNVHFGNTNLIKKASMVKDSIINDPNEINQMIKMLLNTKSKFLQYLTTNLDSYMLNDTSIIRLVKEIRKKSSYCDGTFYDGYDLYTDKLKLKSSLSRYKIYREIFLAKEDYLNYLESLNVNKEITPKLLGEFMPNENGQFQMFEVKKLIKK